MVTPTQVPLKTKLLAFAALFLVLSACERPKSPLETTEQFNDEEIHEVKISFSYATFWDTLIANKDYRDEYHESKYAIAGIEIDGAYYDSVGVRLKGESSYDFYEGRKKSLKIDLNDFIPENHHKGSRKLNLINCFKDPSHIREKLYLDRLHQLGVPAPRASYAKVYINNTYWGLYLLVEQIDKYFVNDFFKHDVGNLYKGEPNGKLAYLGKNIKEYQRAYKLKHDGYGTPYEDLQALTKIISDKYDSDEYFIKAIEQVLNVEDMLKAWAVNNLYMNIDAYNMLYPHNYYLFNDSVTGKFNWISFDGNYAFAAWAPNQSLYDCISMDIFWVSERFKKPLATAILQTPKYRDLYADIMYELVKDYDHDKFSKRCNKLFQNISPALKQDTLMMYKFNQCRNNIKHHLGDASDPGAFTPGIIPFYHARVENVKGQLKKLGYEF